MDLIALNGLFDIARGVVPPKLVGMNGTVPTDQPMPSPCCCCRSSAKSASTASAFFRIFAKSRWYRYGPSWLSTVRIYGSRARVLVRFMIKSTVSWFLCDMRLEVTSLLPCPA